MKRYTRPCRGTLAVLLTLICGIAGPATAGIVYVNKNAPGAVQDGRSWPTAFTAVQPAVDASASGDEVWVAGGTYAESVTIGSGVALYGGFAGSETGRAQRDWAANATVLDETGSTFGITCRSTGIVIDGFVISGSDGYGVTVPTGAVTLTNSTISGNSFSGVWVDSGVLSLTNCVVTGNNVSGHLSAGVYVTSSGRVTLTDNTIFDTGYAGVEVHSGTATLTRNRIHGSDHGVTVYQYGMATLVGNSLSADGGGAVVAVYGPTTLMNNIVSGGDMGVDIAGTTATLVNNAVVGNSSFGVHIGSGTATLTNNTIAANAYCGVYASGSGGVTLANNIVAFNGYGMWRNLVTISGFRNNDVFGNTRGDYIGYVSDPVQGNISRDPLFVDRASGDFHLLAGSPCKDAGTDLVAAGATDLDGNQRKMGAHLDMGAYEIPPQVPWTADLGIGVSGGVAVADHVAYVAGIDGRLHARYTTDGASVPGFPVDINLAVGATVRLPARPAVYYGKSGKAIYLTTDRGDVLRILPSGQVAWHVRPLPGWTVSTPAVTPAGEVFVNLSTGTGPFNNFAFKLDEATGMPLTLSPFLGYTTAGDIGDFSPAANNRYLYVNAGWGSRSGVTVLNQDNMVVRASFAAGEQCLSPLLTGSDLILASKAGKVYKLNAVTLSPDLGFGRFGVADIGGQISAAPFADAAGSAYLGTADGRILKWSPGAAMFALFYSASGRVAALTINRAKGVLGFGTSSGSFVQVPLDNPAGAVTVSTGSGISTGAVYESLTDRFIVVSDTGVLSGWPSIR